MKPQNFDVQTLIDYLQGSCKSLDEGIETCFTGMTQDDLTEEDHSEIDQQIFHCEECGWWCETGAQNSDEDGVCNECRPEDD